MPIKWAQVFSHSKVGREGDTNIYTDTYRQQGGLISLLLFFQNKEHGLIIKP
jgi:hypothetical protein